MHSTHTVGCSIHSVAIHTVPCK